MLSLLCLLMLSSSAAGLFSSRKCYEAVGCFDNDPPFTNSWGELPDSPEDVGVTLTFFAPSDPSAGGHVVDFKDGKSVLTYGYDPNLGLKVIVHGFLDNGTQEWITDLLDAFRQMGTFNVINVAWGPGAHAFFAKAVANTRVVGAAIAYFLTSLKNEVNVSMSDVHLLGHSLGAHIAGYAGKRVSGIGRISGMDPAGPMFENTDPAVHIYRSDADFVDCIHTNGMPLIDIGAGTLAEWCDVDFYPNGGRHQPGCLEPLPAIISDLLHHKMSSAEGAMMCSHVRSHQLYLQSIHRCAFLSAPCLNYTEFQAGHCGSCSDPATVCSPMGYHANQPHNSVLPSGKYYLTTTETSPFC